MAHARHRGVTEPIAGRGRSRPSAQEMYERALHSPGRSRLHVRAATWSHELPVQRWCADADALDVAVLKRFAAGLPDRAEVLDLGCGPGRHTAWLRGAGMRVLGVDSSPVAVRLAHDRGAPALCADVLGPLPGGHHGWDGVLLLDGNIGIGGDPLLLLCRVRDLLRPDGQLLVQLDPSDDGDSGPLLLDDGRDLSATFAWARLSAPQLQADACTAGLRVHDMWETGPSSYAVLRPR